MPLAMRVRQVYDALDSIETALGDASVGGVAAPAAAVAPATTGAIPTHQPTGSLAIVPFGRSLPPPQSKIGATRPGVTSTTSGLDFTHAFAAYRR